MFITSALLGQIPDKKALQSYPLTNNLTWGGSVDWWYTLFDMNNIPISIANTERMYAGRILSGSHADSIWWFLTMDFNQGQPLSRTSTIPADWYIKNYATQLPLVFDAYAGTWYADISDSCLRVAAYGNRTWGEFQADTILTWIDSSWIDGYSSDGTWCYPFSSRGIDLSQYVDFDRSGVADIAEHGRQWIKDRIANGYNLFMNRFNSKSGGRKFIYWTVKDSMGMHTMNGAGWENAPENAPVTYDIFFDQAVEPPPDGYSSWASIVDDWTAHSPSPKLNYLAATFQTVRNLSTCPTPYDTRAKEYYKYLRWTLGMAIIKEAYYSIQLGDAATGSTDHVANLRYDEFNADLGQPTSISYHPNSYTYIRFFERGVVVLFIPSRSSGVTSAIYTPSTLLSYAECDTPYYHFYGNLDTIRNNGTKFISDTLRTESSSGSRWVLNDIGDCLILKTSPDTCIEDIIVDNASYITSAGSFAATTVNASYSSNDNVASNTSFSTGGYPRGSGNINPLWYVNLRIADTGIGSATFTPNIRRTGQWRVYEWHGHLNGVTEATNVPCRINYAGGYKDTTINQQSNAGQWNLLGTYDYTPTGNKDLLITNTGVDGYVNVDAFRWEYVIYSTVLDSSPSVTTQSATLIGRDSAFVNGLVSPNGFDTWAWFEWGTSPTLATYTSEDSTLISGASGQGSVNGKLSSLTSNTTYYFRVAASNTKGTKRGTIYNFTTLLEAQSRLRLKLLKR